MKNISKLIVKSKIFLIAKIISYTYLILFTKLIHIIFMGNKNYKGESLKKRLIDIGILIIIYNNEMSFNKERLSTLQL